MKPVGTVGFFRIIEDGERGLVGREGIILI